jgi:hypothetical protein
MNSRLRIAGWLAVAGLTAAAFVSPSSVLASQPDQHKVTICHATPPDTAANGWKQLAADVASSGHLQGGHDTEHAADIIPPYSYYGYDFPGKNWDATGQAIYNNGCVDPTATTTTTTTSTSTSTSSTDSTTSSETTSSSTETSSSETSTTSTDSETTSTETTSSSTDSSSTSTASETTSSTTSHHTTTKAKGGDPTLPPTDTIGSSDTGSSSPSPVSLLLIAAAGLLAMVLVLTPSAKGRRR